MAMILLMVCLVEQVCLSPILAPLVFFLTTLFFVLLISFTALLPLLICCPLINFQRIITVSSRFYPNHFLVHDSQTGKTLFQATSNLSLYSLPSSMPSHDPIAYLGVRVAGPVWHSCLGHPSSPILKSLLSTNKLSIDGTKTFNNFTCHSCPLGKSVKLPFQTFLSVTHAPLDLIHSNVWSSFNKSVFVFQYYVLFVDNFSRYSWIFPKAHDLPKRQPHDYPLEIYEKS